MNFAVVVFPGSNADKDCYHVLKNVLNESVEYVWHQDTDLDKYDLVILPGGASYGDYLRAGAIARFSPVVDSLVNFADQGKLVLGIGNGFQVLSEARLLPGVLLKNKNLKFICDTTYLKVVQQDTAFTNNFKENEVVKMPIAHGYGNYFCDESTLKELKDNKQILFTYCDDNGEVSPEANLNGSLNNIAGIVNKNGNVFGMMPHPERHAEDILGGTDGLKVFTSMINRLEEVRV
ncbi:MAG TPA: phosphoribosylformylglycinamidine synthase subunit PurQ [Syntrophomonadaceae bacterium]|nr:phosphoribosylformylglycinamidine synthase subunit PurQ [Syntrophomonadaceae bacterium]